MTFGIALIRFALFCVIVGIVLMIVGMAIPRRFRPDAFPFRPWRFETPEFFKRLRVSRWKGYMPDASRVVRGMTRKLAGNDSSSVHLARLVQETCVAELTHWVLMAICPASLVFAPCEWTPLFILLYDIGNLPFIVIQRYNRPRMMKILRMREERERAWHTGPWLTRYGLRRWTK